MKNDDNQCKNCYKNIDFGHKFRCPNCGASFCSHCAEKTQNICPYCYSDLEING